jgi:hypothetical protein
MLATHVQLPDHLFVPGSLLNVNPLGFLVLCIMLTSLGSYLCVSAAITAGVRTEARGVS